MRILILTGKFGMGHWSAAESLQMNLSNQPEQLSVKVEDFFTYALEGASGLFYKSFHLLVTLGSGLYNSYYKMREDMVRHSKGILDSYYLERLQALMAEELPDLVMTTHPICSKLMSDYKRETGDSVPLITCVTDLTAHGEWIHQGTDCYMVGAPHVRAELIAKGVAPEQVLVSGIPVKPQFGCIKQKQPSGKRQLLIMGGGLGLMPSKDSFYGGLNRMPGVQTTLITGNNQKLYQKLKGKYPSIDVVGYTDQVYSYMAQADLILSKPGGVTLFECLQSELPMLVWEPFLQQEIHNARFITQHSIGRIAPRESEPCLSAIGHLLFDQVALGTMGRNMAELKVQLKVDNLVQRMFSLTARQEVRI